MPYNLALIHHAQILRFHTAALLMLHACMTEISACEDYFATSCGNSQHEP